MTRDKVPGNLLLKTFFSLFGLGLVPALVVISWVAFDGEHLVVSGTRLGSAMHSGILGVTLISFFAPVFMLVPPAFAWMGRRNGVWFWLSVFAVPIALTAPTVAAATFKGGMFHSSIFLVWLSLGILMVNLTLWCLLGRRFLSAPVCLTTWAILWVVQDFLHTLNTYILPNLDLGVAKWLLQVTWILPPMSTGLSAIDDWAYQGSGNSAAPVLWLCQIAGIWIIFIVINRTGTQVGVRRRASNQTSSSG